MREELLARPVLLISVAFIGGLLAGFYPWATVLCIALCLLDRRARLLVPAVAFVLLGVFLSPKPVRMLDQVMPYEGEVLVVQSPRPTSRGERAIVQASGQKLVMYYPAAQNVAWGDLLLVKGQVRPISEAGRGYWRHQGVSGSLTVRGEIARYRAGPRYAQWGQQIRRNFVSFSDETLSKTAAVMVQAVCFNHDAGLSQEDRNVLAQSGIVHIISTSGMHVVLVAGMLAAVLAFLPIPRWAQIAVLMGLLVIYAAAAGFRPPMVRSIFMAALWYGAYLWKREADGLSVTAVSAIGTLLLQPSSVYDVGFWLSFVTILALVMFLPSRAAEVHTIGHWFMTHGKAIVMSSLIATLGSAPILLYFFGQFSVVGVVTNLLVVPAIPVIVAVALVAFGFEPFLPGLSGLLMRVIVEPLALWVNTVGQGFGQLPFSAIHLDGTPAFLVFLFYAFALLIWRPRPRSADEAR